MNLIFCVKLATLAHTAKKIAKKRAHNPPIRPISSIVSSVTIPVSAAGVDDITADRALYGVEVDGGNVIVDAQSTKIAIR